jgi:hypothetical protein
MSTQNIASAAARCAAIALLSGCAAQAPVGESAVVQSPVAAPGEPSAVIASDCDRSCLIGFLHAYIDALTHKDPTRAHFAPDVRFTENNVEMPLGHEGLWASVSGIATTGLEVADTQTGNAAWFGTVEEYGEPAYYAMRLRVAEGQIREVETVVDRKTGLPAPFGDPSRLVHDPAFAQALPKEQRRARERLIAVANGYFSTVELNDGQVLTQFDPDCQRTENGISTTSGSGGAAAIAQGCEAQFKLGLYRINKRVRERRYALVDEERGVVVGTGFFDHANTFDSYKTTDGKVRQTALKWPNSISLMEAFKIRDGKIYRVEAVFTYVPYFMHSPWADPPGTRVSAASASHAIKASSDTAQASAASSPGLSAYDARRLHGVPCDRDCLMHTVDGYLDALAAQDPSRVKWAKVVRYSENSVPMMIGDGLWGTANAHSSNAQYATDPSNGNVAWYGSIEEHGQPAHLALRLRVEDGRVSEVEAVINRKGDSGPYGDPANYKHDPAFAEALPAAQKTSRSTMISLVDGYFSTLQRNDGTIRTKFDPECAREENGVSTTDGTFATQARGCESQFRLGVFKFDERVRARRFLIADEERGVVVATGYIDHAARFATYQTTDGKTRQSPFKFPNSLGLMEMFKIRNGRIYRIEAVFTTLPYYMPSPWLK